MASGKRTIRASEIGSFLYCQRAWWYQRNKEPTINVTELAGGQEFHRRHLSLARAAVFLKAAAWILLFIALVTIFIILSSHFR